MRENSKTSILELEKSLSDPIDLEIRTIELKNNASVQIAFLRGMADPAPVINVLTQNNLDSLKDVAFAAAGTVLAATEDIPVKFYLYRGATIVYLPNQEPFAVLTSSMAKRALSEPTYESAIRGPRDGFIEDIFDNLSLIRRRLPDPNLKLPLYSNR